MPGQFRPRGVTMRDCSKNRAGYDRVLMAVAATFLTVSATSALAQAGPARSSAAELAIDAAIPRPEPANVPPPTASDFKLDSTASVPDAAKREPNPANDRATTAASRNRRKPRTAPAAPAPAAATAAPARRAGQGREQRPIGGSARRRQAARIAGREGVALFRSQGRTRRGREVLCRARICAAVDAERHGRPPAPRA